MVRYNQWNIVPLLPPLPPSSDASSTKTFSSHVSISPNPFQPSASAPEFQQSASSSPDIIPYPATLASDSSESSNTDHAVDPNLPLHSEYFIQDELVQFLVDGMVFRVHGFFLKRESEYFRWLLSLPLDSGASHGETTSRTHKLPDVTREEFESLLNFFYHGNMRTDVSIEERINLLSSASRFKMQRVREYAIKEVDRDITSMDPVRRILLARKHDVEQWIRPAYIELCAREASLSGKEGEQLGMQTVVKLFRAREAVLRQKVVSNAADGQLLSHQPTPRAATPFSPLYGRPPSPYFDRSRSPSPTPQYNCPESPRSRTSNIAAIMQAPVSVPPPLNVATALDYDALVARIVGEVLFDPDIPR